MILSDGSTNSGGMEVELVYPLYLKNAKPTVMFLSIEPAGNANMEELYKCIKKAFKRYSINNFQNKLVGLNVDETSVNLGIQNVLGALIKSDAKWVRGNSLF